MKTLCQVVLISTSVLFTGCGNKHEDAAKKAVMSQLNDPSSAQFSELTVYDSDVVCGKVNAKNRMGGYTGAQVFIYNGTNANKAQLEVKQYDVDEWCRDVLPPLEALEMLCANAKTNKTPEGQASAERICENRDTYKRKLDQRKSGR